MRKLRWALVFLLAAAPFGATAAILFQDDFEGELGNGWRWIRENRDGWRVLPEGLEIRVAPGNMWGPENSGKNLLVRDLPEPGEKIVEIQVTVENRPTEQYEQVDLVWYYDDSHMVKLGQELVDGKLSIVMGREEGDRTRTLAIIPLDSFLVQLRLTGTGNKVEGHFRPGATGDWKKAGECGLPVKGKAKVAIQCYQGPEDAEHWARITDFSIAQQQ